MRLHEAFLGKFYCLHPFYDLLDFFGPGDVYLVSFLSCADGFGGLVLFHVPPVEHV
jgi:hypothetical protein